jgi:hypothetical protein
MRKFDQADRKKKNNRIQIPDNPANLSPEIIERLETTIKKSLKDGYLPCASAHKIAREESVPLIAVGEIVDKLGVRITNCQVGCFKVDKTIFDKEHTEESDDSIVALLEAMQEKNELTCAGIFEQAKRLKVNPMAIADVANQHNMKIYRCQLGCF